MITLKRATHEAIQYACMRFHYAKAVPSSPYAYNVNNAAEEWCGVVIFGPGASPNLGVSVGLKQGEYLELVRVALNGKQPYTSEVVSACLRQLHKDAPEIKIVISFADKDQNHFGTIYQATNWIYLGDFGVKKAQSYIIKGKKYHNKTIHDKGLSKADLLKIDPNMVEVSSLGKRKYIYVFDKKLRREWQKKALPYPKKNGGDNN
jgi:hypothetical protein